MEQFYGLLKSLRYPAACNEYDDRSINQFEELFLATRKNIILFTVLYLMHKTPSPSKLMRRGKKNET